MGFKNPEDARAYKRRWRKDNPKERAADRRWRNSHPETVQGYNRKQALKRVGWAPEMYDSAHASQRGLCDICKQPVEGSMCADHEHIEPPKPRGLLCSPCNLALGQFKDSPIVLEAAAAYLRKHGKYE